MHLCMSKRARRFSRVLCLCGAFPKVARVVAQLSGPYSVTILVTAPAVFQAGSFAARAELAAVIFPVFAHRAVTQLTDTIQVIAVLFSHDRSSCVFEEARCVPFRVSQGDPIDVLYLGKALPPRHCPAIRTATKRRSLARAFCLLVLPTIDAGGPLGPPRLSLTASPTGSC